MNSISFVKKAARLVILGLCVHTAVSAQAKFPPVDKSPLDYSYYPVNYPILRIQEKKVEPLMVRVTYSRPQKNGRKVFGELVEYGNIWRLGANEATEIEFFRDAKIGTTRIKKGRYSLFAIPNTEKWTIILNKDMDVWGAFLYDSTKDISRTEVPVQHLNEPLESFSIGFEKQNGGVQMIIGWDTEMIRVPISFF